MSKEIILCLVNSIPNAWYVDAGHLDPITIYTL